MIKISIIIPTKNRKELLRNLLDKLVNDDNIYEIVVVDDKSTDGTKEMIDTTFGENPKLRYVLGEGKGHMWAKKVGFENSQGDVIGFLEDDIIPEENWLLPIIGRLKEGYGIIQCKLINLNEENVMEDQKIIKVRWNMTNKVQWNRGVTAREVSCCQESGIFIKREILEEVPVWDENIIGSISFWGGSISFAFRAKEKGYKILFEPQSVLHHLRTTRRGLPSKRERKEKKEKGMDFCKIKYHNLIYLQKRFKKRYLLPAVVYWVGISFAESVLYFDFKCFEGALIGIWNALREEVNKN